MYKSQTLTLMIHSTIAASLNMLLLYIASTCVTSWTAPRESLHKSKVLISVGGLVFPSAVVVTQWDLSCETLLFFC